MTGNERDAYTLFEVLNDRAMEIQDLELIKNLFLKTYCNNSGDPEMLIDDRIGTLERIWGDEVFAQDLSGKLENQISNLAAIYFTGNESIFAKDATTKLRRTIENDYLSKYSLESNKYTYIKAINDIKTYQMIKTIYLEYGIQARNTALLCIEAENATQVSITYRTFHLLNALGYYAVIPALTNYIIRLYMNEVDQKPLSTEGIDIDDFKSFIKEIKDDYQHSAKSGKYLVIHNLAFSLWKSALLSENYEKSREIARKAISSVYRDSWDPGKLIISSEERDEMHSDFESWIHKWQYKGFGANDLKVKVLFINLFKTKKNRTELILDKAVYSFVTNRLQLDHMEANNPDKSSKEKHFFPADPHEVREKYTDALGNFMILDSENNLSKKNSPLYESLDYYDKMCEGHWMNKEIRDLLSLYHKEVDLNGKPFWIPTEKFFNEREDRLCKYFLKIVDRKLNENYIKLK